MSEQNKEAIEELRQLEAMADLLEQNAARFKLNCRQARIKLEGVSTSSVRKGITEHQIAQVLARRKKLFLK